MLRKRVGEVCAVRGSLHQRLVSKCSKVCKALFGQVKGLCRGLEAPWVAVGVVAGEVLGKRGLVALLQLSRWAL